MRNEDHRIIEEEGKQLLDLTEEEMEYNNEGQLVPKKYVGSHVRNPNGANSKVLDPRQELCWKLYIQGLAKGQPNAKQAALTAGYAPGFSSNITSVKWFQDRKSKLRRKNFLTRAERNLGRLLDLEWTSMKLIDGEMTETTDMEKIKVVADISKYVTNTLGKDEGYSTKTIEEKNVQHDIKIESVSYADVIEAQEPILEIVAEEIKND